MEATAKIGIVHQDTTSVTPIVGNATTEVTAIDTEETENVVADTEGAGEMTDVSAIDTVAIRGIMMTSRDILPVMKMIGVVTSEVHAKTTKEPSAAVAMTEVHPEVVVVVASAADEERVRTDLELLKEGRQRQKALFPCPNENAKLRVGTSMLQVTSNILHCRLNKQVCLSVLSHIDLLTMPPGLFNLPGANRTQIPPILGIAGLPPPMPVQSFGMGIGGNPNLSRQSRRLYIGSITPEVNEQNLADFFNSKMIEMNIGTGGPGNPVLAVQCNYEKNYAFVEVRIISPVPSLYSSFLSVPQCRRCNGCHGLRRYHLH